MNTKVREIYRAFDGKLVGRKRMKVIVCEVLSVMPSKIIKFVCGNCWFLSSMDSAWAFTFTGDDLAHQHMIFISDALLTQSEVQIKHTVAHEIGHVILMHKNSTNTKQSKAEILKQEHEALEFASKYFPSPVARD